MLLPRALRLSVVFVDNYPEPGKRPLSSTVPTIVENEDGSFFLATGGSGGTKIFPGVAQVLLGINDWGLDPSRAIEWGRVHDQLYPLHVEVDDVLSNEEIDGLRQRGHNVTGLCSLTRDSSLAHQLTKHGFASVEDINRVAAAMYAVVKKGDTLYGKCHQFSLMPTAQRLTTCVIAASDSRKNGIAAGY